MVPEQKAHRGTHQHRPATAAERPKANPHAIRRGHAAMFPKLNFRPKISRNKSKRPFSDSVREENPKLRNIAAKKEALPAR
jgi:hypothetical protein